MAKRRRKVAQLDFLDKLIGRAILVSESFRKEFTDRLAEAIAEVGMRDEARVIAVTRAYLAAYNPLFAEHLSNAMILTWLGGYLEQVDNLPELVKRWMRDHRFWDQLPPEVPGIFGPGAKSPKAVRFPRIEKATESLFKRGLMTRPQYDRLTAAAKQATFTVAWIDDTAVIGKIRDALAETIAEGPTLDRFREKVVEKLEQSPMSRHHGENVYRTGLMSAYRDGKESLAAHPIVQEVFRFRTFSATHDGRVRDEHLAFEKFGIEGSDIYLSDDPIWDIATPPLGYNCVPPWQVVLTGRGNIPITSIRRGDVVLTHNGRWRPVIGIHRSKGPAKLVRAETDKGAVVWATAEHRVFTKNGWVNVASVNVGDKVKQEVNASRVDLVVGKIDQGAKSKANPDCRIACAARMSLLSLQLNSNRVTGQVEIEPVWDGAFVELEGNFAFRKAVSKRLLAVRHIDAKVDVSSRIKTVFGGFGGHESCVKLRVAKRTGRLHNRAHPFLESRPLPNQGPRFGSSPDRNAATVQYPTSSAVLDASPLALVKHANFSSGVVAQKSLQSSRIGCLDPGLGFLQVGQTAVWLLTHDVAPIKLEEATITSIETVQYSGDVWNLSIAEDNSFCTGGVFSHNCRCVTSLMRISDAARAGLQYAKEWLKTGVQPEPKPYCIDKVSWRPEPGFGVRHGPLLSVGTASSVRMSAQPIRLGDVNPWVPFPGPRGGKRWRNTATGAVKYQKERPGAHDGGEQKQDVGPRAKASPEAPLGNAELFKRTGRQFQNLQRAFGVKRPLIGKSGAEAIRRSIASHPAGPVLAELLSVDGSQSGYDDNGFADRGMDAYRAAIDGKFSREQLDAAAKWLQDTFSIGDLANVNQQRWIRGAVQTAKPKGTDASKPQTVAAEHAPSRESPLSLDEETTYSRGQCHALTAAILSVIPSAEPWGLFDTRYDDEIKHSVARLPNTETFVDATGAVQGKAGLESLKHNFLDAEHMEWRRLDEDKLHSMVTGNKGATIRKALPAAKKVIRHAEAQSWQS